MMHMHSPKNDICFRQLNSSAKVWILTKPAKTVMASPVFTSPIRKADSVYNAIIGFAEQDFARIMLCHAGEGAEVTTISVDDCRHLANTLRMPTIIICEGSACDVSTKKSTWIANGYWPMPRYSSISVSY
jgi:hypothetical protein